MHGCKWLEEYHIYDSFLSLVLETGDGTFKLGQLTRQGTSGSSNSDDTTNVEGTLTTRMILGIVFGGILLCCCFSILSWKTDRLI